MSNATLQQNVHKLCDAYRRGDVTLRDFVRQVGLHAESFEALPFQQRKELEILALNLGVQADYADEACEYQAEVSRLLAALGDWLRRIPAGGGSQNQSGEPGLGVALPVVTVSGPAH